MFQVINLGVTVSIGMRFRSRVLVHVVVRPIANMSSCMAVMCPPQGELFWSISPRKEKVDSAPSAGSGNVRAGAKERAQAGCMI